MHLLDNAVKIFLQLSMYLFFRCGDGVKRLLHSLRTVAYCRAVYCRVCRCDMRDDHSEVATSTDDYLWLKLGLMTFDETEAGSRDGLTLTQLQTMLLEDFGLLVFHLHCVTCSMYKCLRVEVFKVILCFAKT